MSQRITFKIDDAIYANLKKKADAAGVSVHLYVKSLTEKDTGLKDTLARGLRGASEETVKAVSALGVQARW